VPGLAALNAGGRAQISSLWCAPAGRCSAGGIYTDRSGQLQVFVVSQKAGSWGHPNRVPGAAGFYTGRSGHQAPVRKPVL
jgi:hypothetical protein